MARTLLSGTRIRALRVSRGLAQTELARLSGVSASYLNLIEHNRRRAGPALLAALAEALGIAPEALAEGAEVTQIAALRQAVARDAVQDDDAVSGARSGPSDALAAELDRIDEFLGRFPGWVSLIARQVARIETLEHALQRLADRMAHDPKLSEALHEIVSAVTAVQSTAAILADEDDIDPVWRAKFHRNIHDDSGRLTSAAEALVAYLDASGTESGMATPQEQLESWRARVAVTSGGAVPVLASVASAPELASEAARDLARAWLAQAQEDARAVPFAAVQAAIRGQGSVAPDLLAQRFKVSLGTMFRVLATLPPGADQPRFGLVVCDASGTLITRHPLDGFAVPRFGGACPLWPLFQALAQPGLPIRQVLETATRPSQRFLAHAICEPGGALRFDDPPVWRAMMLISAPPAQMSGSSSTLSSAASTNQSSAPALVVGSACRVCPKAECPARREPSIVTA